MVSAKIALGEGQIESIHSRAPETSRPLGKDQHGHCIEGLLEQNGISDHE